MNALLSPLKELADYEEIIKNRNKESGTIQITGCVNSQKTHLMYALSKGVKYSLVVFSNDEKDALMELMNSSEALSQRIGVKIG